MLPNMLPPLCQLRPTSTPEITYIVVSIVTLLILVQYVTVTTVRSYRLRRRNVSPAVLFGKGREYFIGYNRISSAFLRGSPFFINFNLSDILALVRDLV